MNHPFTPIWRRVRLTAAAMLLGAAALSAAPSIDEARQKAEDGDMAAAVALLQQLVQQEPKNSEAAMLLGDYCRALGDDTAARTAYETARAAGQRDAYLALAAMATDLYNLDEANTLLEEYRATLTKGKKTLAPDESETVTAQMTKVENMLARVEQIEIIDSLVVDADDFFTHYRLSPEAGSLHATDILPKEFEAAKPTVIYEPQSQREMIWSAPAKDGALRLVASSALYGDTWETPRPLSGNLGNGGDANYPFLMPDGVTLYFASDNEDSLGGLDLYISRKGDDGFLQPQNLGMPYNSPYDDYMLAIDEITGVGWWATDRNRIPGKVTIYVFIPSDLRKNIDPESPELAARARISSIRDTWAPKSRRTELLKKIADINPTAKTKGAQFAIYIPGRGVYTNFSDFRSSVARDAMNAYQVGVAKLTDTERKLAKLREAYATGARDEASSILALEKQLEEERAALLRLRNEVIVAENQ